MKGLTRGVAVAVVLWGVVGCGEIEDGRGEGELSLIWVGDGKGHSARGIFRAAGALAVEENVLIRFRGVDDALREMEVVSERAARSMPGDYHSVFLDAEGILMNQERRSWEEAIERFDLITELQRLTESLSPIVVGAEEGVGGSELVRVFDAMVTRELRYIMVPGG